MQQFPETFVLKCLHLPFYRPVRISFLLHPYKRMDITSQLHGFILTGKLMMFFYIGLGLAMAEGANSNLVLTSNMYVHKLILYLSHGCMHNTFMNDCSGQ